MNHDEHDQLWDLLGRARPRKAGPAFVQNVLRAVRMSEPEREPGFFEWLRQGWNWLAFTGAAVVLLFVAIGHRPASTSRGVAAQDVAAIESALQNPDLAIVSNLELLIALDDSNAWLDSSRP